MGGGAKRNIMSFLDLELPVGNTTRPLWVVEGVDSLLSKINSQDIWKSVDFILSIWAKRFPDEAKQFFKEQDSFRQTRLHDTGASQAKNVRTLVSIPPLVKHLLEKLLEPQINAMGKLEFYRKFSTKYPGFANYRKL